MRGERGGQRREEKGGDKKSQESAAHTCTLYGSIYMDHQQSNYAKDNSFSQEKKGAASGMIQTYDILRTRQVLYQLSHCSAGQAKSLKVMQSKGRLSLDKQGTSVSACIIY